MEEPGRGRCRAPNHVDVPMTDMTRYDAIWRRTAPFIYARRNEIHLPLCFDWTQKLLDHYPEADRDICSLAIMLHDIGWYSIDNDRIMEEGFRNAGFMTSDVRYLHEAEGVRMAREILTGTEWEHLIEPVCAIIDGHDTRTEPRDLNDRIVRDADKLWRFEVAGLAISSEWFQDTPASYCRRCEGFLHLFETEKGREMAMAELARTRAVLHIDALEVTSDAA